jgi:hypothetical protein
MAKLNPLLHPPLPLDVIQTRLCSKLPARDVRSVCRRLSDFPAPSRNAQVFTMASIIQDELQVKWSLSQIGSIFDIKKSTIHRIRTRGIINYETCIGHPTLLSSNQDVQVIEYITTSFARGFPVSPSHSASMYGKRSTNRRHVDGSSILFAVTPRSLIMQKHIRKRMRE